MARVALVTGGSRGIGGAISKALQAAGYKVAANYAGNDEAAAAFNKATGIPVFKWDVGDFDACAAGVARVEAEVGPIDVLVNNAGIHGPRGADSALAMDFDIWREVFEVNVYGPLRVAQGLLLNIEAGQGRKIATITSRMGSIGLNPSGSLAYRSSKAAVNMTMVVFGNAVRERGIAQLLFHPGWVRTDMGGGGADIAPSESAAGLIATIDASGMAETNSFRTWQGETIPW